jgi:hypothetical protein
MTPIRQYIRGIIATGAVVTACLGTGACTGVEDDLLNAPDPDVINPSTVNSAEAADALRIGALSRFSNITAGGEGAWMLGGLMTDEWKSGDTFLQRNETDQRSVQDNNGNVQTMLREIYRARTNSREALNALRTFKPTPASNLGQMLYVIGFAELTLAEAFCNGTPLGDASTGTPIYGPSLTNAEVYALALAHFDSALTLSTASDANTVLVRNSALVAKARTLIDLGRFTEVAAVVAAVPTSFHNDATFSLNAGSNQIWALNTSAKRWVVGDSFDIGGPIANAIPFASSNDPRIPVVGSATGASAAGKSFDTSTNFIYQTLFGRTDPTPVASGIDARLYEAEALLKAGDIPGMMAKLNALRAATQSLGAVTTPVLPALATPGSAAAAADLYFREKAFWVFGRGQRLGDLRRLIRQYGRTQATVFPTGQFFKGGTYGTDVNFPVTVDELNNPDFAGCKDRNA